MEYFLYMNRQEFNAQLAEKGTLGQKDALMPLYTWNLWSLEEKKVKARVRDGIYVVLRCSGQDLVWEKDLAGLECPFFPGKIPAKKIVRILEEPEESRTCILMNTSMIDESWCYPALKPYLHAGDQVCVLAFSFFNDTKNLSDWNRQYAPGQGIWYRANTDVFAKFGLPAKNIRWVNYFTDSVPEMLSAIAASNVLLLPGGAPDLMMKRIREKKLKRILTHYTGTIIGYSAGAMVQLEQYHITPDEDYPDFSWQKGMGWIKDLDIEVHYAATPHQKRYLERAQKEKHLDTYAIYEKGGLIVEPDGKKKCFGQVDFLEAGRHQ